MAREQWTDGTRGILDYAQSIEIKLDETSGSALETESAMKSMLLEIQGWRAEQDRWMRAMVNSQIWCAALLGFILWRVW